MRVFFLIFFLFLASCNSHSKKHKYKIEGKVISVKLDCPAPGMCSKIFYTAECQAYTDSIYGKNKDCVWYYNSNGSKVTVFSYKIHSL